MQRAVNVHMPSDTPPFTLPKTLPQILNNLVQNTRESSLGDQSIALDRQLPRPALRITAPISREAVLFEPNAPAPGATSQRYFIAKDRVWWRPSSGRARAGPSNCRRRVIVVKPCREAGCSTTGVDRRAKGIVVSRAAPGATSQWYFIAKDRVWSRPSSGRARAGPSSCQR